MIEIRKGVSRTELIRILVQSERPEELERADTLPMFLACQREYNPEGLLMLIDGEAVAAAGLIETAPKHATVWLVSCKEFDVPMAVKGFKALQEMIDEARERGCQIHAVVTKTNERAKRAVEYIGMRGEPSPIAIKYVSYSS